MKQNALICALVFSLLCPAALAAPGNPNARPAGSAYGQVFSLKKVSISGTKRFTEAEVIKATGLKPGSTVTAGNLQQAADLLGQSGVFAQVSYRFNGETADYTVVDAGPLVPVAFENFVWFSDADLIQRVHKAVPLFNGGVPMSGNLSDQVAAALDSILKEKGIQGHTAPMKDDLAGGTQAAHYRIEGVNAKIAEIHFPGAAPERAPVLESIAKEIAGGNYLQSAFASGIQLNVAPVYGELGFLKAQFGAPKAVILKDDPAQPVVAVEVEVREGGQYSFLAAHWSGAKAIPTSELAGAIDLKVGARADTAQLAADIAQAKEMYAAKGYMNAQVRSATTLDPEKHTAVFDLQVEEGPLYRMGQLDIQGLDPERAALARKVWELREGNVYDAGYAKTFLKRHPGELAALDGWAADFTQTIHDDTHAVDLSLKFSKFQREAE